MITYGHGPLASRGTHQRRGASPRVTACHAVSPATPLNLEDPVYRLCGEPAEAGRWMYLEADRDPAETSAFEERYSTPLRRMRALAWRGPGSLASTAFAAQQLAAVRKAGSDRIATPASTGPRSPSTPMTNRKTRGARSPIVSPPPPRLLWSWGSLPSGWLASSLSSVGSGSTGERRGRPRCRRLPARRRPGRAGDQRSRPEDRPRPVGRGGERRRPRHRVHRRPAAQDRPRAAIRHTRASIRSEPIPTPDGSAPCDREAAHGNFRAWAKTTSPPA